MKNRDVILLINMGALNATAHDLPASEAYKLIAFKRALRKQLEEIQKRQEEIGNDPRKDELSVQMMMEEITLDCKAMPFEAYHALANENKSVAVYDKDNNLIGRFDPFAINEEALEGVLWVAPEE